MESSEIIGRQIIPNQSYSTLKFDTRSKFDDFTIEYTIEVHGNQLDLNVILLKIEEYRKWTDWFENGFETVGVIRSRTKRPQLNIIHERRGNILEASKQVGKGVFVLILDNSYSEYTRKLVHWQIVTKWNTELQLKNLPIMNRNALPLPSEIHEILSKANDCYIAGHFEQSSVMFRKAIEFAIRLKLLQSENAASLFDRNGNESKLSQKIKLLRENNLISQTTANHLADIKWYGDLAAHTLMKFVAEDIENLERRVRAFLIGLQLL